MKILSVIFLLFFLPTTSPGAEPKQEETLEPVVVTATRIETPIEEVTTSISVITAEDIEEQQADTVLGVLRNVPGLDVVQTGSRGTQTSVFIRGSESDQVLVLVDGVEVNGTTVGSFDFANLTAEDVERVEILRGAGGTLYGSQAIGGVINIITKRGAGLPEVTLSTEGGNGHSHRQNLSLRGETGKVGYSITAARIESQGFHRFNDDYRNLTTSGRLDYRLTKDTSLQGIFRFVKTAEGLFNSNNFIPLPDPNARQALSQILAKLEWKQQVHQGWDYRLSGSVFKEHLKFSDDPEPGSFDSRSRDRFRPQISTADFQTNYRLGDWSTSTFGVEFKRRKASTSGGINRAVRNVGYYLQEQVRYFSNHLSLVPGVRLDDNQSFGTAWTPSFSAAYLFRETGTRLKGGYSKGFKAPSLNELFFPSFLTGCPSFGNSGLGPERSWELNAGVEQEVFNGQLKLVATYFHREIKNQIEARPIPGTFCFRSENVGRARFDGVELGLKIKFLSALSLTANYTYLDWDTENGRLPRRPRHRGSVNTNYQYDGFNLNLTANIIGNRDDFDSVTFGNIKEPGYAKVDLAGSYRLPIHKTLLKEMILFGKIENLFNRKFEEADGFRARPLNFLIGIRGVFGKD